MRIPDLTAAFTRSEATTAGITAAELRASHIRHLEHDIYSWAGTEVALRDRCRALVRSVSQPIVFSHQTAAALTHLPVVGRPQQPVHLTVPMDAVAVRRDGVSTHRSNLGSYEIHGFVPGLQTTTPTRTFVDLAAQGLSLEDLVAFGDAVLHHEWATETMLANAVLARAGCRGVRLARAALPLLDKRAESPPESLIRVRIILAGLPPPEPQLRIFDEHGILIGRLDLGYKELKVGIEYEGEHHARHKQFNKDLNRYTELASRDWHILRPGADDLRDGSRLFLTRLARRLHVPLPPTVQLWS